MAEEFQSQDQQKNTVATVGMRFSISGIVSIVLIVLGIICLINGFILGILLLFIGGILGLLTCGYLNLLVGFILGIIGLFYKPRGKARVAITIPLIVLIALASVAYCLWNSVKTPLNEFTEWVKPQFEQLENDENFDGEIFGDILEAELNNMTNGKSEDEWKELFESSTGSNSLEKGAYMLSSIFKEGFENALEKYNNGELPEISDNNNKIITIDVDVENNEEDSQDKEIKEENVEEIEIEEPKQENKETFSQSEKNDIEQILNILE